MSADRVPAERVAAELERVLARPEFSQEPGPVERLLAWLGDLLDGTSFGGDVLGQLFQLGLVLLLATLLAWLVVRALRGLGAAGPRDGEALAPAAAAVVERVTSLRRAADQARVAGDLPRALRLNFWALVVGLGRRGDLEYRDAWTNRELLARGAPRGEVRAVLEPLVDELDAKGFGHEPTRGADVDRLEELCDRWLGSAA